MNETVIHVVGNVGTDVDIRDVGNGVHLSTFRLAATPRYYDRGARTYVDGVTNWLAVQCWRTLAVHVHRSINCGDPVVVVGKLITQEWMKDNEKQSRLLLEASAVGHDLTRGVAVFTKAARTHEPVVDQTEAAVRAVQEVEDRSASVARVPHLAPASAVRTMAEVS